MKYAQFETGTKCKPVDEVIWSLTAKETDIIGKAVEAYVKANPKMRNAKALLAELELACLVW